MARYNGISKIHSVPTEQNITRWEKTDAFKSSTDTALATPEFVKGYNGCHYDRTAVGLLFPQKIEDKHHNPITVKMRKIQVLDNLYNYTFIGNYPDRTIKEIIEFICNDPNLSDEDRQKRDDYLAGSSHEEAYEKLLSDYYKEIKAGKSHSSHELRLYFEPFRICPVGELFIRNRVGPLVDFETGLVKAIKPPYLDKYMIGRHGLFTNGLSDKSIMSIRYNFR